MKESKRSLFSIRWRLVRYMNGGGLSLIMLFYFCKGLWSVGHLFFVIIFFRILSLCNNLIFYDEPFLTLEFYFWTFH